MKNKHEDNEENHDGLFVVFNIEDFMKLPFFCPLCEFVMSDHEDFSAFQTFGCCHSCEITFAQPMREKWESGWRPSDEELNSYKSSIEEKSLNLFLIDGDN